MKNSTPVFPGFHMQTLRRKPRSAQQIFAEKIALNKIKGTSMSLHEKLSEREFQIMCMLANGKSVKEIAGELFISDKTVSTHRMRILDKMEMKKNAELTNYAIKNDLIE